MQGLPIQQVMKAPVKGASTKSVATNTDESSLLEGVNAEAINENQTQVSGGKNSGKIDFATLFEGAKSKDQNAVNAAKINGSKENLVKGDGHTLNKKVMTANQLENTIAKSTNGLDQLLNNLKGTQDENNEAIDVEANEKGNKENKSFFPNQKHVNPNKQNVEKTEKESPLDFLVKGTKENKVGNAEIEDNDILQSVENKDRKSFFQHADKIANKLEITQNTNKPNLKLLSSEDFVDQKNITNPIGKTTEFLGEKPSLNKEEISKKLESLQNKSIDMQNFSENIEKTKSQNLSQINRYQSGQNLLNDNMIKNSKDLAFKDTKKSKLSSIDELLSPDLKKANELSMIKESPLPILMAAKGNQNGETAMKMNNSEKVLDLSHINVNNTQELIKQISDYTLQSNVAGKDHLDLTVTHEQLGQFQISVSKLQNQVPGQNQIDMQILTSSPEGHKFFVENEGALAKSLQQSGINLSDLRVVSSMSEASGNSFAESKQFSSFNQNQNGSSESHQSFQSFQSGDFKNGNEKRKDLWNEYRERYGA